MRNDDVPGFIRKFLLSFLRRAGDARRVALCCMLLAVSPAATLAQSPQGGASFPVGIREIEYVDPHEGGRHLTLSVFYPAAIRERPAAPFVMPFFTRLNLYKDAEPAFGTSKHPLVMFSHGRGSNGLYYAWFAEFLAAHGYIVAALNHYRANTYDSTISYLANKLWQRPRDIGLSISLLLNEPFWGKSIDADRIGVAGHSQGGFTALWVGGARINPDKYLAFQRGWRNNQMVPEYLRNELPLDAAPALDVHDQRVKAVKLGMRDMSCGELGVVLGRRLGIARADLHHGRRGRYPGAAQGQRRVRRTTYPACRALRHPRPRRPRHIHQRVQRGWKK